VTWSRLLSYLLAAAGLRWIARNVLPNADAYLAIGAICVWLALAFHRRTRRYAIEDALNRATDSEREALLSKLRPKQPPPEAETPTISLDDALTGTLVFTYPKGSRSTALFQFWSCVVFGMGFLGPLALGRVAEASDGWILFLLGGLFSLAGMGHRHRLHWLSTEVTVSPEALEEKRGNKSLALPWHSIVRLNRRRWSHALAFEGGAGRPIVIWPELVGYRQFEVLAAEHLRVAKRGAG
jgi:hypothetical protein